jgi:uncharacterized protein (TIGR02271 family)
MTNATPNPFETGAKVFTNGGEEIGTLEDVRTRTGHGEQSMLVVRMTAAGNLVLIPLALIDSATSTTDSVRLNVDAEAFRTLRADRAAADGAVAETGEPLTIPVHEEELIPVTRDVHLGDVVIHKRVEEEPVKTTVNLRREDVSVERVAIDRVIESVPEPRYEGDTLVIPLVEEVLVTEKRLVLREEVRITRHARTDQTEVRDVLRREVVDIEEHHASGSAEVPGG